MRSYQSIAQAYAQFLVNLERDVIDRAWAQRYYRHKYPEWFK